MCFVVDLGSVICVAVEVVPVCGGGTWLQKRLKTRSRGVVRRIESCSLQWIRICIGWIGVVSEDEENSDPKAEERRPGKVGDRASWRARPVSLDRARATGLHDILIRTNTDVF